MKGLYCIPQLSCRERSVRDIFIWWAGPCRWLVAMLHLVKMSNPSGTFFSLSFLSSGLLFNQKIKGLLLFSCQMETRNSHGHHISQRLSLSLISLGSFFLLPVYSLIQFFFFFKRVPDCPACMPHWTSSLDHGCIMSGQQCIQECFTYRWLLQYDYPWLLPFSLFLLFGSVIVVAVFCKLLNDKFEMELPFSIKEIELQFLPSWQGSWQKKEGWLYYLGLVLMIFCPFKFPWSWNLNVKNVQWSKCMETSNSNVT